MQVSVVDATYILVKEIVIVIKRTLAVLIFVLLLQHLPLHQANHVEVWVVIIVPNLGIVLQENIL